MTEREREREREVCERVRVHIRERVPTTCEVTYEVRRGELTLRKR